METNLVVPTNSSRIRVYADNPVDSFPQWHVLRRLLLRLMPALFHRIGKEQDCGRGENEACEAGPDAIVLCHVTCIVFRALEEPGNEPDHQRQSP